jgi:hypothetical protein
MGTLPFNSIFKEALFLILIVILILPHPWV